MRWHLFYISYQPRTDQPSRFLSCLVWNLILLVICYGAIKHGIRQNKIMQKTKHIWHHEHTLHPLAALTIHHFINHDDVIQLEHFPRYWPFVWGIHRSPVNSPHKGQWRGALVFYLTCDWLNGWVNNREAGDLRRHRTHYGVTVMYIVHNARYALKMTFVHQWLSAAYSYNYIFWFMSGVIIQPCPNYNGVWQYMAKQFPCLPLL